MERLHKKRGRKAPGLPPGTPVYVGRGRGKDLRLSIIDYAAETFKERSPASVEECFPLKDAPTTTWINVDGLEDVEKIKVLSKHFGLHSLVVEDIVNTGQRPKFEDFGEYLFVVIKMLSYDEASGEVVAEQVSLILGERFVLSFQEAVGDVFEPIRERLRTAKGRIRNRGADYLAYALLDAVVDNYFAVLEKLGDRIEDLEEKLISGPAPDSPGEINRLKRELLFLRKSIWPLREVISGLQRSESSLIEEATQVYLRDVYDHTIQVADTLETYRDMAGGMLDTYLSSLSNRMNEVMKVLTVIATIFIPLTFIAGIYGMNFEWMPELKWPWGYPAVWGVMLAIFVTMILYFKRRKWL